MRPSVAAAVRTCDTGKVWCGRHNEFGKPATKRGAMRLWLDDLRPPPPGWEWAKTVEEAILIIESGEVVEASLDHDLG